MPIHDWMRVSAGVFHAFLTEWMGGIQHVLNNGILPEDYYALAEQVAGDLGPDVLTLAVPPTSSDDAVNMLENSAGGVALAVESAPPQVDFTPHIDADRYASRQRTLVIRHVSEHRIVAMIEIVSPGNKSNRHGITAMRSKLLRVMQQGIHLLVIDLLPPTPRDPHGIHALIWSEFADEPYVLPPSKPLTFVAYACGLRQSAYVKQLTVGDTLPAMPLFLTTNEYVTIPLEESYQQAFLGVPRFYRSQLLEPTA